MTTRKRSRTSGAATPKTRRTAPRSRARKAAPVEPEPLAAETIEPAPPESPIIEAAVEPAAEAVIVTGIPEPGFAAHLPPPEPAPPRPTRRRGIFFDVENTSRATDISRVVDHLALDWVGWTTDFTAVGNWRVIGHDTARLLAQHGAALVHSAPSVGVRDWSDLRIAVSAGVWLAGARPGDVVEIVSDDQAFDAVGDVAASLGVTFRRTSYRALAGGRAPDAEAPVNDLRPRRSRRGGRRGRSERRPPEPSRAAAPPPPPSDEPHTAPHDELVGVVRDLLVTSPSGVSLDALANALRERGFSRPPGSPRLITRLRRIKQLDVSRAGTIRLVESGSLPVDTRAPSALSHDVESAGGAVAEAAVAETPNGEPGDDLVSAAPGAVEPAGGTPTAPEGAPRRRRRRGGRRRRGRRNGAGGQAAVAPDGA